MVRQPGAFICPSPPPGRRISTPLRDAVTAGGACQRRCDCHRLPVTGGADPDLSLIRIRLIRPRAAATVSCVAMPARPAMAARRTRRDPGRLRWSVSAGTVMPIRPNWNNRPYWHNSLVSVSFHGPARLRRSVGPGRLRWSVGPGP